MPTTHQQIEAWKARLLDLGRRNRLLHSQPGRAGTVALTDPPVEALFDVLARSRRKLTFAAALTLEQRLAALSWDAPATGVTMRLDRIPTPSPKAGQIMTDLSPVDQDRVLYNLRLKARTALNEQGVNILFVALGFLEWFAPDAPEQIWRSPLLLLPVELQRAPLGAEYSLRPLDDEIALNPTLAHKLRQDFGLVLPDLPEEIDELQLEQVFAEIGALVAAREGWRVVPEATLGLFSFLKLLMYHDLDRAAAAAEAHPILSMLAGGAELKIENAELKKGSAKAELKIENADLKIAPDTQHAQFSIFNSQFPLDQRSPEDCFQVLDADSSQADAIAAALAGQSFVLQGPPGTGKSQTITNIIAECMAAGKRVLFVSEKMAALQVVFERLKQCGLADFCLEAHSHKASKRAVLDALGAALNAPPPPIAPSFPYAELAATRAQLNDYAAALHAPHGPQRWTPYHVYARLAGLADAPDSAAPLGDLDGYTPERLGAIDTLLARIDTRRQLLQSLPGNVWRGCAITTGSFELRGQIRTRLRALLAALSETQSTAARFAEALELPTPNALAGTRALHGLAGLLHEPHLLPAEWLAAGLDPTRRGIIAAARQDYAALADAEARLAQRHRETLLELDLDDMLARFTQRYASWTRVLRPQFHRDLAAIRASLQPRAVLDPAAALADLQLATAVRATREREHAQLESLATRLGSPFEGRATDWDALAARADWADRLLALPLPMPLPERVAQLLTAHIPARAAFISGTSGSPAEHLHAALNKLDEELTFFLELKIENAKLTNAAIERSQFSILNSQFSILLERMGDLDSWWEFSELRRAADTLGVAAYLDSLSTDSEAPAQPRQSFHKRLCMLWLDAAYDRSPALRQFQRAPHEALVERFYQLDLGQLAATQARLHQRLAARRPLSEQAAVPGTELAILRRELQKQRRHKPIRQLFREMPDLLGRLKPCLLMSPLSVSQFLDPDAARFDLVIFDEASQIRTEDAVGAVLRGTALIVVGDNKQLPPTSFFMADAEGQFVDEDQDAPDSFESILDAAGAGGLPARMLRWHYRSRDESLIAFSNARFYAGRLATFPNAAAAEGHGVSFEHVPDGVYDRQSTRANPIEARRVADIICRQLTAAPERSLGVVAFSQSQQLAILHELERRRAADPTLDPLFDEARADPFFVKNLENVQGDERDIMIVSVGYGRDAGGRLLMNFGPLNQQGGERRLNVAITRARRQVTLVSSLLPEDIDLKRTTHPGPRLLREYLEYARRGGTVRQENQEPRIENRQPEAGSRFSVLGSTLRFEDQLAAALAQRGLSLARQIGHSDFRIDIAIRDPRDSGRFLLGIECDGDDYRDAATARDRERLRAQVLGNLGWDIQRVWSADWAQSADAEVERMLAVVNDQHQKNQEPRTQN